MDLGYSRLVPWTYDHPHMANFCITHFTHCSTAPFHSFHFAFYIPQFRILPTAISRDSDIHLIFHIDLTQLNTKITFHMFLILIYLWLPSSQLWNRTWHPGEYINFSNSVLNWLAVLMITSCCWWMWHDLWSASTDVPMCKCVFFSNVCGFEKSQAKLCNDVCQ